MRFVAHESFTLDETDLRIVHALQVEPRASWSLIGSVTEVSPTTAMRRWKRLTEAGAAWIACYPAFSPPPTFAVVELMTAHGRTLEVAAELAADPHAASVNVYAGDCDVLVEVYATDYRDMSRYVLERLALVSGIREIRTHLATGGYREGSQWRLGQLDAAAEQRLVASGSGQRYGIGPVPSLTPEHREVARVLEADPRIPVADLATALGVSAATAHRRLNALLSAQPLLRCELCWTLSEWPISATFFIRCPAPKVQATGRALATVREVRAVIATTGPNDLFVAVRLRSVDHVRLLEEQIVSQLPHVVVTNRSLVIRPVKLMGHLLDEDGWRTGNVPIDFRRSPMPAGVRAALGQEKG